LLLEGEAVAGEGEVVIGGEESDQAHSQTACGLEDGQAIQARPGAWRIGEVWRKRGGFAVAGSAIGRGGW
jgi:hypothetical protein